MRNFRIGSLLGIPILVNPSWFILFGLTTWLLATQVFPSVLTSASNVTYFVMAAASVLVFFTSIVIHELAHSVVAKRYQIPVRSITLFVFGGVAQITRDATRPVAELLMALAGPMTSFVLGGVFLFLWWAITAGDSSPLGLVLFWLAWMNIVLGAFNLVPAFPMDGGRVFRSLMWLISGNYNRATQIACWTGRGIAWVAIGAGVLSLVQVPIPLISQPLGGAWIVLIGVFLENAARQSLLQNRLVTTLRQYSASQLMVADPPVVEGAMSVGSLARGVLELNPRVCYFVEDEGRLAGILSSYQLRAVPEQLWDSTTAAQVMVPSQRLKATGPESPVSDVLLEMEASNLLHMPVVREGRVIGVIGRDRILGVLRNAGLLGRA
jgi:Zn-dependent protease